MSSFKPQDLHVNDAGSQTYREASPNTAEKTYISHLETKDVSHLDLDRVGETQGYVLDEILLKRQLGLAADAQLKTAGDGRTVLIPQPTGRHGGST